jgi:hypothetical protein
MVTVYTSEEQKKALAYTFVICAVLLLLFFLIRWTNLPVVTPEIQDQLEINLGNNFEGYGDDQPLIKGSPTNTPNNPDPVVQNQSSSSSNDKIQPEDDPDAAAAPITKSNSKTKNTDKNDRLNNKNTQAENPKPKLTYTGPQNGKNGNNSDEDNEFKGHGKNPDKIGDDGTEKGNKDSYGNHAGGTIGGPKVINGNRRIKNIRPYKFTDNLKKGTVLAIIMVDASGKGRFVDFAKGSSKRDPAYVNAIKNYLVNMEFDKSDDESKVTVQFIFDVN